VRFFIIGEEEVVVEEVEEEKGCRRLDCERRTTRLEAKEGRIDRIDR
jgi:hypothetical protein